MKALRKYIDKIKPQFEKGGKFEKLHSTFEAFESFLFVPDKVTFKGSHIRDALDLKRTMTVVIIAVIPALLFGMWNVGFQHFISMGETVGFWDQFWYGFLKVLPIIIVSYVVGLGTEFVFAQIRGHEVNEGYLVTGMLIPLIVPPDIPLWMLAIAVVFAVIIGKEVFGGTGMNILNPALTARAFLFFAYPQDMSGDKVWISDKIDAYSGATPLGDALVGNFDNFPSAADMFFGFIPGSVGETSFLAILIGAVILLFTGIASWRIMFPVFAGGYIMGVIFNLVGANAYMDIPAYYHLIMGGFAFGAVFMATDPVTASQTNKGKYIYGFLIGILAVLIRVVNPAYPEGMMLAILLMNVFAPLIDHYVIEANIKRRLKRVKIKV
ncbi:MAG: NADH:ubiquinone reductase (Na(+)-transporting) subunit B [Bacteroidetes bacterium]|nr:NADH:ubiquinone reductase (Na(+)-transporting) subunit B [Bacteroidota bacterium]MBL7102765.1 NADH:ubiquinone reductase (Na(+)-transporting) subunit B [Bacteroidales bacterium]